MGQFSSTSVSDEDEDMVEFYMSKNLENSFKIKKVLTDLSYFPNYEFLPIGFLHETFKYLPVHDICRVMQVCRVFFKVINTVHFWKEITLERNLVLLSDSQKIENWKKHFYNMKKLGGLFESNQEYFDNFRLHRFQRRDSKSKGFKNCPRTKIIILGEKGLGKSSYFDQVVLGEYSKNRNWSVGKIGLENQKTKERVLFTIHEPNGMECFEIPEHYYKGVGIALIFFSLDKKSTFKKVEGLYKSITGNIPLFTYIIGNKSDSKKREVSREEIRQYIERADYRAEYVETSVKERKNLLTPFFKSFHHIITQKENS